MSRYIIRLGDDGRPKAQSDSLEEAYRLAEHESSTNWAGKAQILDDRGKLATFRDGKVHWERS